MEPGRAGDMAGISALQFEWLDPDKRPMIIYRLFTDGRQEIEGWSPGWSQDASGAYVYGEYFFDETPEWHTTAESSLGDLMTTPGAPLKAISLMQKIQDTLDETDEKVFHISVKCIVAPKDTSGIAAAFDDIVVQYIE
jgi:hypothetical protein